MRYFIDFRHIFFCILFLLFVSGCTALKTFPNAARSGDTVALAVGSPLNMNRGNTTAIFTSDIDGIPVDLSSNIRSIFKLYADPTSQVFESTANTVNLIESSNHAPWITIAVIDLPQGLSAGPGQIQFTTNATYPAIGSHINNLQIPLEILAGTGSASTFDYEFGVGAQLTGDLSILESQTRAVFGPAFPSVACPCPDYAAIEIEINAPTTATTLHPTVIRVVAEDLTVQTNSSRSVIHSFSPTGQTIKIVFLSPTGTLKYYEAQFSVVLHSNFTFTSTPTITSINYYDNNGNQVSGPVSDYSVLMK